MTNIGEWTSETGLKIPDVGLIGDNDTGVVRVKVKVILVVGVKVKVIVVVVVGVKVI